MKFSLGGQWQLTSQNNPAPIVCTVPGTVYGAYLDAGLMEDPYYRDNEMKALALMDDDFTMQRNFLVTEEMLSHDEVILSFLGLDTLCEVKVNHQWVGQTNNMHRTYEFNVKSLLHVGENDISIRFASPTRYIKKAYESSHTDGAEDAMVGFPLLRKAHCMFGWDWGPRLPDCGIWREVSLVLVKHARLEDVHIRQHHENGNVSLNIHTTVKAYSDTPTHLSATITTPNGDSEDIVLQDITKYDVKEPQLWWPSGLGDQPLYTVHVRLMAGSAVIDEKTMRIGLRTMTMQIKKDQWGESFAHEVNGVAFFAMGGDYIPEDNLLGRVHPKRTRRLLEDAKLANFNCIRVWGGGHYPSDDFYDLCDELGLVVWQDFMFACAVYDLTEAFEENIRQEAIDNVRRIRHHASLGLWCGNNEMEMFVASDHHWVTTHRQKADYIKMYEYIFPKILKKYDPDTFYWPASPSSGGSFDDPNGESRGDAHYWDVWHGNKPFTEYRKFFFRYVSEFGFQAFPDLATVERFTLPEDRNVFSYVMEKHQRNNAANGKIMNYMAQTYRYPTTFETVLYASQLLSAQAIQYGVEHWRRNRGRCMGAVIWQLNDCWPVASWASIDYYGRWKALHYSAKRFFAPVLLSCEEDGMLTQDTNVNEEGFCIKPKATLNVSNEQRHAFTGTVRYQLVNSKGDTLLEGSEEVSVAPLCSLNLPVQDFSNYDPFDIAFTYELYEEDQKLSSGSVIFCAPKYFHFQDPCLTAQIEGDEVHITASAYAKGVTLIANEDEVLFSDSNFDMLPGKRVVKILRGEPQSIRVLSVYDIG